MQVCVHACLSGQVSTRVRRACTTLGPCGGQQQVDEEDRTQDEALQKAHQAQREIPSERLHACVLLCCIVVWCGVVWCSVV